MMKKRSVATFADAQKEMRPVAFSTMLKPAGSACNLDCAYCYYLDKAVQYGGHQAVMSDELLEEYVRQYITANAVDVVTFCWHGGEPLFWECNSGDRRDVRYFSEDERRALRWDTLMR